MTTEARPPSIRPPHARPPHTRPARTRLPPEQRRTQLLTCAIAAAAEHGLARVTHAHVAERAGVSVSAVHSYFRTRDDLVGATLAEVEAYLSGNRRLSSHVQRKRRQAAVAAKTGGAR